MSGGSGDNDRPDSDAVLDEWLSKTQQSTQDDTESGGGEKRGEIRTGNEQSSGQQSSVDVSLQNACTVSVETSTAKRDWKKFVNCSPGEGGSKRSRVLTQDAPERCMDFISIGEMRDIFCNVTDKEGLAVYVFSACMEPLRHMRQRVHAKCNKCNRSYALDHKAFKPTYEQGHAIFDLHCVERTCGHVTQATEMAGVAEKVLL